MYNDFVPRIARYFEAALAEIESVYNFELGPEFEIAICKILRRVLPQKFGICRGYVVTREGSPHGDDVIIYDRMSYPTLRGLESDDYLPKEHVPIEAAYAYIEAKHTLEIEGSGPSSLRRALDQVSLVKAAGEARVSCPIEMIAPNVKLAPGSVRGPAGWPHKRNPFYAAIFARQVRLRSGGSLAEDAGEIVSAMTENPIVSIQKPDLVVAGTSVVGHAAGRTESDEAVLGCPFNFDGSDKLGFAILRADNVAFGIGVAHLLWALSNIQLMPMPWREIVFDAISE